MDIKLRNIDACTLTDQLQKAGLNFNDNNIVVSSDLEGSEITVTYVNEADTGAINTVIANFTPAVAPKSEIELLQEQLIIAQDKIREQNQMTSDLMDILFSTVPELMNM